MLKKGCLFGCMPLLVLLLAGALASYRMATWTPPPAARPQPPTPRQAAATREKIRRLDAQLRAAAPAPAAPVAPGGRRERAAPGPRPFRLALNADDLNALWFDDPKAQQSVAKAGFREPRIELADGAVRLSGYARALGRELYVQIAGAPATTPEGWLGLRIDDIRVGQLPAPARLREALTTQLQVPLRDWSRKLGARLSAAGVEGNTLVLAGTATPPRGE